MRSRRIDLLVAACFCGAIGLYDALYVLFTLSGGPVIGPSLTVLFPDFLVFHAAVRAWFEGKLALVYDIDAFTAFQNAIYTDRFPGEVHFRPFFYPPVWLDAAAVRPSLSGQSLWRLHGGNRGWPRRSRAGATSGVLLSYSPAAVKSYWPARTPSQRGASLRRLRLLDRRAAAGILLGLLSYKPQIWVLVPLALLAARQWRAFAWMTATVAMLSLASLAVFGPGFWFAFLEAAREAGSERVVNEMFERIFMHMTTLLAAARILGLPPALAGAIQLAGAALAVAAVWFAFRRQGTSDARTAVLVTATFLVSPYTLNYDLLLLMPAAVALFRRRGRGLLSLERLVYLALWLIPTFGMILNRLDLPVMPLIVLLFGAIAWARVVTVPKVELPSAATAR